VVPLEGPQLKVFSGDIFSAMITGNLVHTSTVLMRRSRFENVNAFNESLHYSGEDFDFHLRTCREGQVAYLDVPSVLYRLGAADQLTGPRYRIYRARNFLRTILPVIRAERAKIALSSGVLRRVLAEGYYWAGEAALDEEHRAEAALNLVRSLFRNPLNVRALLLLVASAVPRSLRERGRLAYRSMKSALS
jgi:hypothetical protein